MAQVSSILNSWKEIASYVGRGVRTAQRWHNTLQFPVHQISPGSKRSPVFAYKDEIDRWLQRQARQSVAGAIHRQQTVTKESRDKNFAIRQRLQLWRTAGASTKDSRSVQATAQLRLETIKAQLAAGFNLCTTAENALVLCRVRLAREAIAKASHAAKLIRTHVNKPGHLPAESIAGLLDRLAELDKEISNCEGRFSS